MTTIPRISLLRKARRRLALLIYPEWRHEPAQTAREVAEIPPQTAQLLKLAEVFVRYYAADASEAALTYQNMRGAFYKWIGYKKFARNKPDWCWIRQRATEVILRLIKHPSTGTKPETHRAVLQVFSNDWPAGLAWPADIPRPAFQAVPSMW